MFGMLEAEECNHDKPVSCFLPSPFSGSSMTLSTPCIGNYGMSEVDGEVLDDDRL